jgi:hypothetical protein
MIWMTKIDPILHLGIQDAITWIKHQYLEGYAESRRNLTYSEAHGIAQKHFNGATWENNY